MARLEAAWADGGAETEGVEATGIEFRSASIREVSTLI
ncbi:hypothetical protein J2R76_003644 [Bradyrhizobium sp. USDA 4532]|nr:hypothetical protein [Bradyrhizobium sp. USDA 4545]MCP1920053.1 hypothetical protein [Bradyrhizobium sp. USDA 4532]